MFRRITVQLFKHYNEDWVWIKAYHDRRGHSSLGSRPVEQLVKSSKNYNFIRLAYSEDILSAEMERQDSRIRLCREVGGRGKLPPD